MNVFHFSIEVKLNLKNGLPWGNNTVGNHIISQIQKNVAEPSEYKTAIQKTWNDLSGKTLKTLFAVEDIVAIINPEGNRCFMFLEELAGVANLNHVTLRVLIISDTKDLNHSIKVFLKETRRLLPKCKVRILEKNNAFLYVYNNSEKDIFGEDLKIRADFVKVSALDLIKQDLWRIICVGLLAFYSYCQFHFNIASETTVNLYLNIYAACIMFLLIEVIFKIIIPGSFRTPTIVINDLSGITTQLDNPLAEEIEKAKLTNPDV